MPIRIRKILQGTLGDNLLMPFKNRPGARKNDSIDDDDFRVKAEDSGNSIDPFDVDWVDPTIAGLESSDDIRDWWFQLVEAMGIDDFMVRRVLRSRLDIGDQQRAGGCDCTIEARDSKASKGGGSG